MQEPGEPAPPKSSDPVASPIGIPERPAGEPPTGRGPKDFDLGVPVGPTPNVDFWDALYARRSIRKFKDDPVPREWIEQLMHAGIWAPSSCNYQMWDLVAVDDPEINGQLAALSTQMGNAPVNIVVSYGREFSEESWANIQSASALIQNMSLAAQALGLGTFWITQTGDREKVREVVGLPIDRLVIAVLAVGFPKTVPKAGPKRRPLSAVTHWNHYGGRPIPSSANPADWHPDDLTVYQRARVLNGLRHNKPRPWEMRAISEAVERFLPNGSEALEAGEEPVGRWLEVLPCTGIVADKVASLRRGYRFDVVERSSEVADWCLQRVRPRGTAYLWPDDDLPAGRQAPSEGTYDVVSCFFRLEGLAPEDRPKLLERLNAWLAPGGVLLLGYVSKRSFHNTTEKMRARHGGPRGVEYVLSPDPNIGPFEALEPKVVREALHQAGLTIREEFGTQPVPQPEEVAFRTRNFSEKSHKRINTLAKSLGLIEKSKALRNGRGRFRFLLAERRPPESAPDR